LYHWDGPHHEQLFINSQGSIVTREQISPRLESAARFAIQPLEESGGFLQGV
jgi:hypothetical protein